MLLLLLPLCAYTCYSLRKKAPAKCQLQKPVTTTASIMKAAFCDLSIKFLFKGY